MADYEVINDPELVDDTIDKVQSLEQETGQASDKIMSQKAVTDMILDPNVTGTIKVKISTNLNSSSVTNSTIRIGTPSSMTVGNNSLCIGGGPAVNGASNMVAIGMYTPTAATNSVSVGYGANAGSSTQTNCVSIGASAVSSSTGGIAIGTSSKANSIHTVALGSYSVASEPSTVSVGDGSTNTNYGTRRIVNVKDPVNGQDAATKNYVDSQIGVVLGGSS